MKHLEKNLRNFDPETVEKLKSNLIPCKHCFFKENVENQKKSMDNDFSDEECEKIKCLACKDQKFVEISNTMKILNIVTEDKLKRLLLMPLAKLRPHGSINLNTALLETANEKVKNDSDFKTNSCIILKQKSKSKSKNNKQIYGSMMERMIHEEQEMKSIKSVNPHQNRKSCFTSLNYQNIEIKSTILPNYSSGINIKGDNKLKYKILENEANRTGKDMIEVRLVIINKNSFDWPQNIRVKGTQENPVSGQVDYNINASIKKNQVKGVKFNFKVDSSAPKDGKVLDFLLFGQEGSKVFYSNPFKIWVKNSKTFCIFNICNFI